MIVQSETISKELGASINSLNDILGFENNKREEKSKNKKGEEGTESTQKDSETLFVKESANNAKAGIKNKEELKETLSNLSAQQVKALETSINKILDASTSSLVLADKAVLLVDSVANDPIAAAKVGKDFKDLGQIAKNLPKQAKEVSTIALNVVKVAGSVGLKINVSQKANNLEKNMTASPKSNKSIPLKNNMKSLKLKK